MMLRRLEPFRELTGMREAMDRFFQGGLVRPIGPRVTYQGEGNLSLDIYHTPESLVIKAAIPGVKPEEVDITVTGNILTIKGEAGSEDEVKEKRYLMRERRYGTFSRVLTLPKGLKTDEIEAVYGEGVLTLTIPKAEEVKPRVIKVNVTKALEDEKAA